MYETKFRAWDTRDKVYFLNALPVPIGLDYSFRYEGHVLLEMSKRFVFQLFTGLKDKNGTPIYDGDIVAASYIPYDGDASKYKPVTKTSVIKYMPIQGNNPDYDEVVGIGFSLPFGAKQDLSNCEVIGNVYETPELLKIT